MIVDCTRLKNSANYKTFYYAMLACFLLPVAIGFQTNAQAAEGSCGEVVKQAQAHLKHQQSRLSTCRSAKFKELENFNAKRERYHRLISWSSNLEFATSLNPYVNALNERDRLLASTAEAFESCVPELREITVTVKSSMDNAACEQQLAGIKSESDKLTADLKTCQACSVGNMSTSINHSAMEILVLQQKDARVLRHALYQQLSDDIGDFSQLNQWLMIRDVYLAYITDTAVQQSNTQKLIVMLEHLEQKLQSLDTTSDFTDKVINVYRQLAKTLQSKNKHRLEQAERFWTLYVEVVPEYTATSAPTRYSGFDGPIEMAQRLNAMPSQERDTIVAAINTALKKYQTYTSSS
jgi:hypothetical protein